MATGRPLFNRWPVLGSVARFLESYLRDPQVQSKVKDAIIGSLFDLSKPAGQYGGIPRGFKVEVKVDVIEEDLQLPPEVGA